MCNVQTGEETTGRNMSWVEKRLEGKCMGWKNDWREYVSEIEILSGWVHSHPVAINSDSTGSD